jgi:toxin ParE1/3/4
MTRSVRFLPEAEAELFEAMDWYQARGRGLGDEFARAVEAAISAIERFPEIYPVVRGMARRLTLRRFPYNLVYVATNDEIVVVACIYAGRDPRRWHRRV